VIGGSYERRDSVVVDDVDEWAGRLGCPCDFDEHISKLNAGLNRWETIKKWAPLDRDLSIETGELTPSLKVKRTVVAERYREMLDAFYA
jgi:long-subunit acyl-CoA synthetase (AMP-forming)